MFSLHTPAGKERLTSVTCLTPTTFTRCFLLLMRQLWENLNNSPQQTSFNLSVILWCCHCFVLFCCMSQTLLVEVSCCLDFFSKISWYKFELLPKFFQHSLTAKRQLQAMMIPPPCFTVQIFLNKISSLHFFPPDVVVCILPKDLEHWTFRTLI